VHRLSFARPWIAPLALGVLATFAACMSNRERALAELAAAQGDAGTIPPASFEYRGEGCAFTFRPPEARGFVDFSLNDDAATTSPATGTPIRVRLGLAGGTDSSAADYVDATTQVAITWETPQPSKAAVVRLGKSPTTLDVVRKGYSWTTPPPEKGLGTNEPPAFLHEVHLCGLEPGTTYYYQVGGGGVFSEVQSFTTLPKDGPLLVGIMGDARDDVDVWRLVQRRMKDAAVNLQVFSGDMVFYGTLQSLFQKWLDAVWKDPDAPGQFITLGQQAMVMVGGNHESASSQFYGNFAIPGDGPFAETFGSFDVGPVHFVFIDDQRLATDKGGEQATAQIDWLRRDLDRAQKARSVRPFIVAVNHRPQFSTSKHRFEKDVANVREALVPLFDQYQVDLVFAGHDHEFERSKPLRGGNISGSDPQPTVQPTLLDGTTYVVSAGCGAEPYGPSSGTDYYREKQEIYGSGTPYRGFYTLMRLEGRKMTVTTRGIVASSTKVADDAVVDEFVIDK
jgi:predicted phosphodiesterase